VLLLLGIAAITVAIFAPLMIGRMLYLRWVEMERRLLAEEVAKYEHEGP